jgi:hypothetical protein
MTEITIKQTFECEKTPSGLTYNNRSKAEWKAYWHTIRLDIRNLQPIHYNHDTKFFVSWLPFVPCNETEYLVCRYERPYL